ncbi:uncharacterized protein CLUP02_09967 [Colletotrichum lupini]|uniref:Uncharacterized protein n=4 Tax=Colletotrichum acutatum species complex TaxID=2707335 RepID=A0A9Q0B139_9PEZI|nr:uncharacterized protein CLUP02_09967 [Colletotrichum lupini]KAI3531825.1 hypothetical protein CSPX01_13896 [Colletotrichum filicis]KAI3546935.1 hypothetical protein CABS02_08784 [Colletotrichum abscissum]KAK0373448.1 hypothetical protein CLIM01_09179 [Colletotrichum limetticola]UQC84470.1 hypothetical protein CLUP02_09967 [Colletotrichum lupini]
MATAKSLDKATRRCHWAANPCRALVRFRGPLHRLGFWDAGPFAFWGGGEEDWRGGSKGGNRLLPARRIRS